MKIQTEKSRQPALVPAEPAQSFYEVAENPLEKAGNWLSEHTSDDFQIAAAAPWLMAAPLGVAAWIAAGLIAGDDTHKVAVNAGMVVTGVVGTLVAPIVWPVSAVVAMAMHRDFSKDTQTL